ncbi:transposase [Sphaerisporangium sp. NPDC088356]|uniref:IS701 family transposase n=1 Tax=Sphaerisporangium sp. NPDC088356 TaxID=3154871 RepID=UPI0034450AD5
MPALRSRSIRRSAATSPHRRLANVASRTRARGRAGGEQSGRGVLGLCPPAGGRALIDRRLYLPQTSWLAEAERCRAAGVPSDVGFATKPALAGQMIAAALDAGVAAGWVSGDEVYGQDPGLRELIEDCGVGYVLAIAGHRRVKVNGVQQPAAQIAQGVLAWQCYSAGDGAKGPRWYAWAWKRIDLDWPGHRWLLIRRNVITGELAFYRCFASGPVLLTALVRVAGARWAIDVCHLWCTSSRVRLSLRGSVLRGWFVGGLSPAGAGVEARWPVPALV